MKKCRESCHLLQKELSELSGVPYRSIQEYECDNVMPGILNLIDIADAMNVSLDELIGRDFDG